MEKLFDFDIYQGCRVTQPDQNTILVEGGAFEGIMLRFEKTISVWRVELHVSAKDALGIGSWRPLWANQILTAQQKILWCKLQYLFLRQQVQQDDGFLTSVMMKLSGVK